MSLHKYTLHSSQHLSHRLRRDRLPHLQILLPIPIRIRLLPPVKRRPLRILLKQPHRLGIILLIRRKPMINPRGHNHQISLLQFNPHPFVLFIANIEVTSAVEDVANFFVFVEMFVEEVFHFFFVVWEEGRGDFDFVAVFVLARAGYAVYFGEIVGEFVVEDAEFGEVGRVDFAAAVVGFALVALVVVCISRMVCRRCQMRGGGGGGLTGRLSYQ